MGAVVPRKVPHLGATGESLSYPGPAAVAVLLALPSVFSEDPLGIQES